VKLFLKNKNNFLAKNHCEIQVRTICALYLINIHKVEEIDLDPTLLGKADPFMFRLSEWRCNCAS